MLSRLAAERNGACKSGVDRASCASNDGEKKSSAAEDMLQMQCLQKAAMFGSSSETLAPDSELMPRRRIDESEN
jgi:hypothetical protein